MTTFECLLFNTALRSGNSGNRELPLSDASLEKELDKIIPFNRDYKSLERNNDGAKLAFEDLFELWGPSDRYVFFLFYEQETSVNS